MPSFYDVANKMTKHEYYIISPIITWLVDKLNMLLSRRIEEQVNCPVRRDGRRDDRSMQFRLGIYRYQLSPVTDVNICQTKDQHSQRNPHSSQNLPPNQETFFPNLQRVEYWKPQMLHHLISQFYVGTIHLGNVAVLLNKLSMINKCVTAFH